jgi:deazaflavin-dependent oxidoreductase (nitroreductase family)
MSSFSEANRLQRAMRTFGNSALGAKLSAPTAHRLDTLVLRVTKGRRSFTGLLMGVPTVMLTTTGAKSGQERTAIVLGLPHPEGLGLIASNWGQERHPAWYHNLKANPAATVSVNGQEWRVVARLATDTERDQIWAEGLAVSPAWKQYQARAGDREIQAFVLVRQT